MKVAKKDVGFRTITLKYDGIGKLNEFEKKLINSYEDLHLEAKELSDDINQFSKAFAALEEHCSDSQKMISKTDKMLEKMYQTATIEKKDNGLQLNVSDIYVPSMELVAKGIEDYNKLPDANNKHAEPLNILQMKIINDIEDKAAHINMFSKTYYELNKGDDIEELDMDQLRLDFTDFLKCHEELHKQWMELHADFTKYIVEIFNPYALYVSSFGERYKKLNDAAMAKAEEVIDTKVKRIKNYELPANSEQMTKYAAMLDEAGVRGNGIYLEMSWAAIDRNDTSAIMDIIRVAQHKTDALRNVIYGIQFKINDIPLSEPMGSRQNIFMSPKILAWFAHLGEIPMIYFFIRDPGTGSHCLFADMILDGSLEVIQKPDEGATYYGFQPPNINIIFNRLFEGAVHFLEFCYGTGVDAKPHVDYAIQCFRDGFQLDTMFPRPTTFKYEDVEEEWRRIYRR
jgi:hypothetical protein